MLIPKFQIRLLSGPLISSDAQSDSASMQPRATKPERAALCQNHVDFFSLSEEYLQERPRTLAAF